MGRKKKQQLEDDMFSDEEFEEISEEDITEDESDGMTISPEDYDTNDFDDDNDMPANPMGLAFYTNKESETAKSFKELPKETRYSYLTTDEAKEIQHRVNTYRDFKYIQKILSLRQKEDQRLLAVRKELKTVATLTDLKEYIKSINRHYLLDTIEDMEEEEINLLLEDVKCVKKTYFPLTLDSRKKEITDIYEEFKSEDDTPSHIDDMGNVSKIVALDISSMGRGGKAAQHSVMTINAVKNEDIEKDIKEKTSFSFLDAIKKRFS